MNIERFYNKFSKVSMCFCILAAGMVVSMIFENGVIYIFPIFLIVAVIVLSYIVLKQTSEILDSQMNRNEEVNADSLEHNETKLKPIIDWQNR